MSDNTPVAVTVGCCDVDEHGQVMLCIKDMWATFSPAYARMVANNLFTCADHLDSLDRHAGEVAEK